MPRGLNIIVIASGEFSGGTSSLITALRNRGHRVIPERITLRNLRFRRAYATWMLTDALLTYGTGYKGYLARTHASFVAKSRSNHVAIARHSGVDAVIMIGANCHNFWKRRLPGICYTVFTDHTNALSKRLPIYSDVPCPERDVRATWNRLEGRVLREQDHVFVMSSHVMESVIDDYEVPADRVSVVGAGPNLDIDVERDRPRKDWTGKRILFVGLERRRKGLPELEAAFRRTRASVPEATLDVVGVQGISGNGITYHGRVYGEPLKELFYDAQIFALPSFREPFGFVFSEAMWAKNACIGTNTGALPEVIAHGETGYIVEPGDIDALTQRLTELLSSPDQLAAMGEAGYARAKDLWRWDRTAARIEERLLAHVSATGVAA